MLKKRFSRALAVTTIASLVMATAVFADNLDDTLASGSVTNPTIAVGGSFSTTINYQINRTGSNNTTFPATVTFALNGAPSWVSLAPSSRSFAGYADIQSVTVSGTAPAAAAGITFNFSVDPSTSATNLNPNPAKVNMSVTVSAPSNTGPTVPGTPGLATGSETPSQGGFSLEWTASTDDGLPNPPAAITYELQGRDADDASFATIASSITSNSYSFASGQPAEGTWIYRVRASDGSLVSDFSGSSASIVVDRTAPSAPTASFTPPTPDYTDGSGLDWWKTQVAVAFGGSTDPALADASAGSGVEGYAGDQTFTTTGTHTYSGTATDNAGNTSSATTGSVGVDATAPVVSLTCPTDPLILGSTAFASWTASDQGSGLATAASGSIGLDTSSVGSKTATASAGTAIDNVGNESAAATCSYAVIYDWDGFFRPIDNDGVFNVVKAGQAIPVKFSLNGNQGLGIISVGWPSSRPIACDASAELDPVETTVTAGSSSLSYDAEADQYVYVWKTDKAWANSCRQLTVRLVDGTSHTANFKFTK